ncbi:helix-turn-helix transcriptional regulator [Daejeonella sp.]|uniref:helix-turn-helix domain-containing protein n=1 Tax=Daejeonella sp. TaxID=2805397 RepID=UPI0030BC1932
MGIRANRTEIEMFLIDKVKEKRLKAGLSQAQLARELDLSVGFIGNVESPNHRAKYNLNHINELAKIFNCNFGDFFPEKPF